MKAKWLTTLAVAGLIAITTVTTHAAQPPKLEMTTGIPATITVPDKVKTSIGTLDYFDGAPTGETVATVYDYRHVWNSGKHIY